MFHGSLKASNSQSKTEDPPEAESVTRSTFPRGAVLHSSTELDRLIKRRDTINFQDVNMFIQLLIFSHQYLCGSRCGLKRRLPGGKYGARSCEIRESPRLAMDLHSALYKLRRGELLEKTSSVVQKVCSLSIVLQYTVFLMQNSVSGKEETATQSGSSLFTVDDWDSFDLDDDDVSVIDNHLAIMSYKHALSTGIFSTLLCFLYTFRETTL